VPKPEPLHRFANNPYSVFGRDYVPLRELKPYKARGIGSWYGRRYHGQKTSSGEIYDMYAMTAAHPILPIPSYVRVTNPANGKSVVVRINDRGPFHAGREIDLSWTAAYKLGYTARAAPWSRSKACCRGSSRAASAARKGCRPRLRRRHDSSAGRAARRRSDRQAGGGRARAAACRRCRTGAAISCNWAPSATATMPKACARLARELGDLAGQAGGAVRPATACSVSSSAPGPTPPPPSSPACACARAWAWPRGGAALARAATGAGRL
jgi:rare lipoprotein A